jgi:hypothetical protein
MIHQYDAIQIIIYMNPKSENCIYSRASKLGNSLSSFRDSVLSKLARKNKTNSSLDLARSDGRLLVVASESRRFLSEFLKDIIDETVHDPHSLA